MNKIFVLDTSVLLFDHNAINNFEENDIAIPITVLEELDKFKVGSTTLNYECREFIRILDNIAEDKDLNQWIDLGEGKGRLKIILHDLKNETSVAQETFNDRKNDHKIIDAAFTLKKKEKKKTVILVSKDINLRLKAKALGLPAENYKTGTSSPLAKDDESTIQVDHLHESLLKDIYQFGRIDEAGILGKNKEANHYYILNNCSQSALARYDQDDDQLFIVKKKNVYGIKPKNSEQTFAIDALLNPDIKLVALEGVAGTGKTLLALAAALEQKEDYDQIILARPIVPLSNKEIGFLPGNAEDKISPYMQPLWDNLRFIKTQFSDNSRKSISIDNLLESGKIEITALTFIRGRSLTNTYFIIDEAQNLTPHEIKTIITRAGEGTKIVFTGDVHQIDTPYMDASSNGLAYLIDKLKNKALFAHIKLLKGERSELANLANELL